MKNIIKHIKDNEFKQIYLIYGPEAYLRKQYRDKLRAALLPEDDTMNYTYYEGKKLDIKAITSMADTLPFFADRRLIVIENSGFFTSSQDELNQYLSDLPDTTYLIFVEEKIDKRNKLYKTVNSKGYTANMETPTERDLSKWIAGMVRSEQKQMDEYAITRFISYTLLDMDSIKGEIEKLVAYTKDRDRITFDDVLAVCTPHTENKIFDMIQAIATKNQKKALDLYYDLIALKEEPLRILYLIASQFNLLLQIKELVMKGYSSGIIAERTGKKDFIIRKNISLCQSFHLDEIHEAVSACIEAEEAVKTGRLNQRLAVELIISKYSC